MLSPQGGEYGTNGFGEFSEESSVGSENPGFERPKTFGGDASTLWKTEVFRAAAGRAVEPRGLIRKGSVPPVERPEAFVEPEGSGAFLRGETRANLRREARLGFRGGPGLPKRPGECSRTLGECPETFVSVRRRSVSARRCSVSIRRYSEHPEMFGWRVSDAVGKPKSSVHC
jgi:hypothetical protein